MPHDYDETPKEVVARDIYANLAFNAILRRGDIDKAREHLAGLSREHLREIGEACKILGEMAKRLA